MQQSQNNTQNNPKTTVDVVGNYELAVWLKDEPKN